MPGRSYIGIHINLKYRASCDGQSNCFTIGHQKWVGPRPHVTHSEQSNWLTSYA